jgi:hypothetical protein
VLREMEIVLSHVTEIVKGEEEYMSHIISKNRDTAQVMYG